MSKKRMVSCCPCIESITKFNRTFHKLFVRSFMHWKQYLLQKNLKKILHYSQLNFFYLYKIMNLFKCKKTAQQWETIKLFGKFFKHLKILRAFNYTRKFSWFFFFSQLTAIFRKMFWKFGYLFSLNRLICLKNMYLLNWKIFLKKKRIHPCSNKIQIQRKEEGLITAQPSKFTLLLELSFPKELFSQPKDVYFYQFHNSFMRKFSQAENWVWKCAKSFNDLLREPMAKWAQVDMQKKIKE